MNPQALLVVASSAVLPLQASAIERMYEFRSTVQSMFEHDAQSGTNTFVSESSLSGYPLRVGDLVLGRFSYDDSAQPSPFDPDGADDGYLVFGSAVKLFSLTIATAGFSYTAAFGPGSNVVLSDESTHPSGWDTFSPFSQAAYSSVEFRSANLNLFDHTGTAINGYAALPSSLKLSAFHHSNLHYAWLRRADGDQFHFDGALTALNAVSTVPEPSAALLLLLGGAAVLVRRRRHGEA